MPEESDPLQSLIADILEAENRGDAVDREAFLRQHPDHADSLREFFANHDSMKAESITEEVSLPPANPSPAEDVTLPPKRAPSEEATLPPSEVASEEEATLAARTSTTGNAANVGDKIRYFGDYELIEEIARGGMGVVYKARQINLNRIVALKMILAGQLAGEEDVKRFYTEAEAAANLDHPGIVPIFEVGQYQGQHYFSMGFIEGQSLAQKVADGPLPPREAAELVKKICEAMAYAHERGVIHRDLKPANILLDQNGQPKVTDFGLAKQMNADSGLTGTGQILGTPSYMAPEQASGKVDEVGPLADVYALGAILYCLLTGRPPFQAANPMDTLLQVLDKEPINPRQLNSAVAVDLETICLKCLNKESQKRYCTTKELLQELDRFFSGRPILARPINRIERATRWCKRNPAIASLIATAVCLLVLGSAASSYFALKMIEKADAAILAQGIADEKATEALAEKARADKKAADALAEKTRADEKAEEALEEKARADQESFEAKRQQDIAARSLYANQIAAAQSAWDSLNIRGAWQQLDACQWSLRSWEHDYLYTMFLGGSTNLVGHSDSVNAVAYSPDGTHIVSGGDHGHLRIWDAASGEVVLRMVGHREPVNCVAYSPSGNLIASGGGLRSPTVQSLCEVKVWDAISGKEIFTAQGHEEPVINIAFSPDGSQLISSSMDQVRTWDSKSGELLSTLEGVHYLAISPDANHAVGRNGAKLIVCNLATGEEGLRLTGHRLNVRVAAFSPDGTKIASAGDDKTVRIWNAHNGTELLTLIGHTDRVSCVAFSPDGAQVISGSQDKSLKVWDIVEGNEITTFAGHAWAVNCISINRTGTFFVSGSSDQTLKIWDMNFRQNPRELNVGRTVRKAAIDCKGKLIAWGVDHELGILDASTGKEIHRWLAHHPAIVKSFAFHPNGSELASGGSEGSVKLWDIQTGELIRSFDGHGDALTSLAFDPKGSLLASGSTDKTIRLWDSRTGVETRTLAHSGEVHCVAFSNDGKSIVVGCSIENAYPITGELKIW